jgi:tetratricopeptide (TPR) repeat protein
MAEKSAVEVWRAKLDSLQLAEATATGAAEKFALSEQISEARDRILELERPSVGKSPPMDANATRPALTPNNLPRLQYFFGRETDLKKIADALAEDARGWGALIDGPGGIGKTSLAVRAAELVPRGRFRRIIFLSSKERELTADGQRSLGGFVIPSYLEILNAIARELDQADLAKSSEAERPSAIVRVLHDANVLLVLDNLETLPRTDRDQLFAFLNRLPRGCSAIVTSRRRADASAIAVRLDKLDWSAADELLTELARDNARLSQASDGERRSLYEETGGNPLLIRWITGQLGLGHCRDISSALDFLRSAPPGNDPLEFIFGDLLDTFTKNETQVLAALTHFTMGVEIKFIAELASINGAAAQGALIDLSSRALVLPDVEERRFVLVPMVADFLRRKRPDVIAETGKRLEERAYGLIVENGYQNYARFPTLDSAWPTVVPALPLLAAGPNPRFQTVCDAIFEFLNFTGRYDEALSLNQRAEAKSVADSDYENAGWRAYQAGWIHFLRAEGEAVLSAAGRAKEHWENAQSSARERGFAIRLRGLGHKLMRSYPAAISALHEALDLWRTLSAESGDVALALNSLAAAEDASGDLIAAEKDYREALRVGRVANNAESIAVAIGNLSRIALLRGDFKEAENRANEALPLAQELGRRDFIAAQNHNLANALLRQGRPREALPFIKTAINIYSTLGSPDLKAARDILAECEASL